MRHGNDLPQGTPRGARTFGEPDDADPDGPRSGGSRRQTRRPEIGAAPQLPAESFPPADERIASLPRALPESIARWEGEGGRLC